jgi:hypothetical protein
MTVWCEERDKNGKIVRFKGRINRKTRFRYKHHKDKELAYKEPPLEELIETEAYELD